MQVNKRLINDRTRVNIASMRTAICFAVPLGIVGLIYWPMLVAMARIWEVDPSYSHGYLVPLFAAAFACISWRRDGKKPLLSNRVPRDELIGGFLAIGGGLALHGICMLFTNLFARHDQHDHGPFAAYWTYSAVAN